MTGIDFYQYVSDRQRLTRLEAKNLVHARMYGAFDQEGATKMVYRHAKRGTLYRLITRCSLTCQGSVAEKDVLKIALLPNNDMRILPDSYAHDKSEGVWARGELQSDTPLAAGTILVCYQEIDEPRKFWFRPESEFDDGRFVKVST